MVLNGLGFVNRLLYLTPEFYANKPVEVLIGPGIAAEDLNDDCLGRALDWVVRVGVTEIYYHLAAHALQGKGIENRFAHADTSAFSVEGAYKTGEEQAIKITYGYTKDHRPDLKQAMLGLICANRTSIPVWLEALGGHRADKKALVSMVTAYVSRFSAEAETPYLIADSALYSAENLKALSSLKWVTRVPATLNQAQAMLTSISLKDMTAGTDDYFYYERQVSYGDVEQR